MGRDIDNQRERYELAKKLLAEARSKINPMVFKKVYIEVFNDFVEEHPESGLTKIKVKNVETVSNEPKRIKNVNDIEKPISNHSYSKQNNRNNLRMAFNGIKLLFICMVFYFVFFHSSDGNNPVKIIKNEMEIETVEEEAQNGKILGYWKSDLLGAGHYYAFYEDGTYKSYLYNDVMQQAINNGAPIEHFRNYQENGTYKIVSTKLTLNRNNYDWDYSLNWVDDNNFVTTFVSDESTWERISEEEFVSHWY